MTDASAREALQRFGLDPLLLESPPLTKRRKRAVWRAGVHALKWLADRSQAEKILTVSRHLHARGIALPVPVEPGFVETEAGCWLLFPWVEGRMPTYEEPGMLDAIAGLLGRFHHASAGCGPVEPNMLDWARLWSDRRHHLHKVADLAAQRDDPFSLLLQRELPWLRERVRWCQKQLLMLGAAARLSEAARAEPLLGHGDYSRQNLILTPDGGLTVIDLDQVSTSLPVRDLSRLLIWVDHDLQGWSQARFERIITAYGGLTPDERDLLLLDQAMPHLAIDIAREYYNLARSSHGDELERCLQTDRAKLQDLGLGPAPRA